METEMEVVYLTGIVLWSSSDYESLEEFSKVYRASQEDIQGVYVGYKGSPVKRSIIEYL